MRINVAGDDLAIVAGRCDTLRGAVSAVACYRSASLGAGFENEF
jgi:hypothetical protein